MIGRVADFSELASEEAVKQTAATLQANGMTVFVVGTGEEAKNKVLSLIPEGSEVMNMSSVTLDTIGISHEIMESGKYHSVKKHLSQMDRATQGREMAKLGSPPDYAVGSVHAATEEGHLIIASNTGSQLPAYAYGAGKVILVVGTQKIVPDLDEGMRRIYEYILPLESERLNKQYNLTSGSFVSKLLIINREIVPGRITVIFVKEKLGF